ncbi:MAG: class I SAM-dependent methyltransferase [Candidatus Thiodiazotropha sp. 6PLUC2]
MKFKAWFKSNTADRALLPLRKELVELIEHNSTLLEVGCGTGDLLFQAASKISSGHGVDIEQGMIKYAEAKRQKLNLNNLSFECIDALAMAPRKFDVSTSTLCLHEMPEQQACALLNMMVNNSGVVLVADFTAAKSTLGRLSIEFDEILSGHYGNYRQYRRSGMILSYSEKIGARVHKEIKSVVDGISIWVVSNNVMVY